MLNAPALTYSDPALSAHGAKMDNWTIGQLDSKAAFLQAYGFDCDIFIRPLSEHEAPPCCLRKLDDPAYCLADSKRLWYLTSHNAHTNVYGLCQSKF